MEEKWWCQSLFEILLHEHSLYALFKLHWLILILAIVYFYVKNVIQSPLYNVTAWQKTYFFTAVFLGFLIKCTPLDVLVSHFFFSVLVLHISIAFFVIFFFLILPMSTLSFLVYFIQN